MMELVKASTFPRRPLCLESRPPPFFTATSRVRLWSSTRETVNSNLKSTITAEPLNNQQVIEQYEPKKWDSRLIVNRVQVLLERVSFPPARPPFVREQVEADVRVRAVVGERDQVSVEGNDPDSEKHRPYCI